MKLILIHGLGQTPDSWNKVAAELAAGGDSICPDLSKILSGHEVNYQNLYAAFSDICSQSDGPVDLCGLSLGGVLALNYATEHPENVRSIVLIAAQYKMPANLLRLQNIMFHFMPKSMFRQMGFGKADFIRLCQTMMALDFSETLAKITCRTLVLCGEKDSANKKAAEELSQRIVHAELRIIPAAGHELNVEAPELLATALRDFYAEV